MTVCVWRACPRSERPPAGLDFATSRRGCFQVECFLPNRRGLQHVAITIQFLSFSIRRPLCQGIQKLNAISLFSGVGGLEAGTRQSGTQRSLFQLQALLL